MLKETIKFTDYNGNEREIVEYFHLTEAEIVDMQAKSKDGIQKEMQDAILSNDAGRVLDFIRDLVHKSYGKKSDDGLHFEKSPEILQKFINSAYYSDFMLGLIENDGKKGQEFVKGIMPAKLVSRATQQVQGQNGGEPDRTVYGQSAREIFAESQTNRSETQSTATTFGQPAYPQFTQNNEPQQTQATNTPTGPQTPEEWEQFRQWSAQQEAARATQASTAPVSPDAFRVREEEQPMQGLPRPPHEQGG